MHSLQQDSEERSPMLQHRINFLCFNVISTTSQGTGNNIGRGFLLFFLHTSGDWGRADSDVCLHDGFHHMAWHESRGDAEVQREGRHDEGAWAHPIALQHKGDEAGKGHLTNRHARHTQPVGKTQLFAKAAANHGEDIEVNAGERKT